MRLAPDIAAAIREEVRRADPDSEVWLFGSRADENARGGDIDLLVVSDTLTFAGEIALRSALLARIGWQHIDLVVRPRARLAEPFAALALETGVRL